jgi:hypothetical protein
MHGLRPPERMKPSFSMNLPNEMVFPNRISEQIKFASESGQNLSEFYMFRRQDEQLIHLKVDIEIGCGRFNLSNGYFVERQR